MSAFTAPVQIGRSARSPKVLDAGTAAVAFALTLALLGFHHGSSEGVNPLSVVLAAIACFPLLAHRRAPLTVFAVCAAGSAVMLGLGYAPGPPIGPTCALFFVAGDQRTRDRLGVTAVVVLGLGVIHLGAAAIAYSGSLATPILGAIVLWGAAWIAGDQLGQRRQRLADLVQRAERAERDTKRERQLAAAEERTRIARDLHDSAAHAINVILVQAGGARLLQERDPEAVRAALHTIEDVARETINEIDQLIRGLRETPTGEATHDTIDPPIGLAAADTLADRHRAAGLPVHMHVIGLRRPLAPGLDQAAYRILQESLTNAARHGTGHADVKIAYGERRLELTVSNPLPSTAHHDRVDSGHGIQGMRERAALLNGTLEVSLGDARFCVHARLPYAISEATLG
ncbi:MAG TPA: histidine kinase [Solirubrobacteraceae bacterium]|nr:histidine kinase [Solirubrobacteraceae bacterium]